MSLVLAGGQVLVVAAGLAVAARVAQAAPDVVSLGRPQLVELPLVSEEAHLGQQDPGARRRQGLHRFVSHDAMVPSARGKAHGAGSPLRDA
jgi:hypothetical protein